MISPAQYSSKRNSVLILSSLNVLRFRPRFSDVTLLVGERRIPAQRHVLAAFSDYFRATFEWAELTESGEEEIRLEGLDADAVERVVDFCYTSVIEISEENVEVLLEVACFLQVEEIKDYCCEFLELHIAVSNCLDIRQLGLAFHCAKLVQGATKFIQYHFVDLVETKAFRNLHVDQLAEIVSLSNLRVESECSVFEAVMHWARLDGPSRASSLHLVLPQVRLPLLDPDFVEAISHDDLVSTNIAALQIIEDAKDFLSLPKSDRPRPKRWWSRPRHRGKKCVAGTVNLLADSSLTSSSSSPDLVPSSDPHWSCYEFHQPIRILRVDLRWSCSTPLTIQFECSNDGKHWKLLSRTTYDRGGYWRPHALDVAVPQLFRFYRLFFSLSLQKKANFVVDGDMPERKWRMRIGDVKMLEAVEERVEPTSPFG